MIGSWEGMHNEAPPGAVWCCSACGKTARNRHGGRGADRGWDASCYMHATLVREDSIERDPATGRVKKATAFIETTAPVIEAPNVADLARRSS